MPEPVLSVIVPSFNSAAFLDRCLSALLDRSHDRAGEVIVVDDGSEDGSVAVASRPGVQVVGLARNVGPGAARNIGATQAQGDVLVFVDADVAVDTHALGRLASHFAADSACAAVIGSYDDAPHAQNLVSQYRNLLHCHVHQKNAGEVSHFWTGIGAIRKSVFAAAGGFDEAEFGRACEDVELGYRLRDMGHRIRLDRSVQGKHLKRWSLAGMLRTDLLVRAIPWTRLLLLRREAPRDFSLAWSQRISVLLACLLPCSLLLVIGGGANALAPALLVFFAYVAVNLGFFRFLQTQRGWAVTLTAIPLHWLYHFNSGLGFVLGVMSYFWRDRKEGR